MDEPGATRHDAVPGARWPGGPDGDWPAPAPPSLASRPGAAGPRVSPRPRGLAAPLALPAGFFLLLLVGAIAAATHGGLPPAWVLILAAAIVGAGAAVSEPAVAPVLAGIGWLTVLGFSGAPYAQLSFAGRRPLTAALIVGGSALAGAGVGPVLRRLASSYTLWIVKVPGSPQPAPDVPGDELPGAGAAAPDAGRPEPGSRAGRARRQLPDLSGGIGRRRLLSGALLVAGLPLLTMLLSTVGLRRVGDDLLVYLVAVVAVAVVGGFWPAVVAAITASVLVNWYFTPPVHTLTIGSGQSVMALLLFVTVAVTVSSVVHLAAHRARQAACSTGEAQELLALAQTVLGGADTPGAVLAHLTAAYGGRAELTERSGERWVTVAVASPARPRGGRPAEGRLGGPQLRAAARADLALIVSGQTRPLTHRLLHGYAAQAAAALDRDRLRTQAAQAEALAEGNRMRTALLAAVSHDLRTPLASIKASVSTLRQTDVTWTPADEAALLATIERSSDRLDALIGNLLDMSRLTAGSLQPFLRPTDIDEVAPVALRGLDAGDRMRLAVPDDLPLVRTDPGLLERVLANLFDNALTHSPAGRDPELRARRDGGSVLLDIVDHGRGVPDQDKERIFEAFQRLDPRASATRPGGAGGVGLGLAVVRGFLDIMGGRVEAADTPGGGLTMRVRLPAVQAVTSGAGTGPA
jgi:two-component system, OmpR family, sensor histidine kinase KdpD